jgi:CheY-like chemotaxis protein
VGAMRILIAEDDLTSRNILAALLKKKGHEVMETTNGADAWTVMQKPDAPRMAILDWMMPEMDGLEVVRRIRELQTEQPPYLIMLTAKGEKSDIVVGLDAGADDYLVKPFDAGELKARIEVGRRIVDLQMRLAEQVTALQQALKHIKTLQGIIPICSFCKKIRNDKGYWDQVEAYVGKHSQAEFSHSICPECMAIHYPEYADEIENDDNADED